MLRRAFQFLKSDPQKGKWVCSLRFPFLLPSKVAEMRICVPFSLPASFACGMSYVRGSDKVTTLLHAEYLTRSNKSQCTILYGGTSHTESPLMALVGHCPKPSPPKIHNATKPRVHGGAGGEAVELRNSTW